MWFACVLDVRFTGASRRQGRVRALGRSQQQLPELEHGVAVERSERSERTVPPGSRYTIGQTAKQPRVALGYGAFAAF